MRRISMQNIINKSLSFCLNAVYLLSLTGLASVEGVCKPDPLAYCRCQAPNGDWIDLTPLVSHGNLAPLFANVKALTATDTALYNYRPCTAMKIPESTGTCDTSAVCQKSGDSYINAGTFNAVTYEGEPGESGFSMKYSGDDGRQSVVYLECSTSEKEFTVKGEAEAQSKKYEMTLKTKYACISSSKPSSGGLSVGSILLIVFFVLLVVYLVGGVLILRFARGARGVEQIPNYTFWMDFPGLVKDGAMFVCRGCKADSDRTYDQI